MSSLFSGFAGEYIDDLHYSILNEEEYEIEAESEDMAKDFAVEKYLWNRASSMEFDFEVEEI